MCFKDVLITIYQTSKSDDPKTAPCGVAAEAIDNDISFESPLLCKMS